MNLNIYEIFDQIEKAPTKPEKKNVLLRNKSPALLAVLRMMFGPKFYFYSEVIPPYKVDAWSKPGMSYNSLSYLYRKLYLFEKNHPEAAPNLSKERRDILFANFLEGLEKKEAETLIGVVTRTINIDGLTEDLVYETFPEEKNYLKN